MSAKCPTCGKTVYFAEEVKAIGLSFHKRCLKCAQCNKTLDVGHINDRQGKVYCGKCYSSIAGLKGFGHGVSSESSVSGGATHKATYANAPIDQESALAKGFSDGYSVASNTSSRATPAPRPADEVKIEPALLPVPKIHQQQLAQQSQEDTSPASENSGEKPGGLLYVRQKKT